jgi:hypothetical protein
MRTVRLPRGRHIPRALLCALCVAVGCGAAGSAFAETNWDLAKRVFLRDAGLDAMEQLRLTFEYQSVTPPPPLWSQQSLALEGWWPHGPNLAVAASGDLVLVGDGALVHVVDFTDPANPVERGSCMLPSAPLEIEIAGDYAYVADGLAGVQIIDISNPDAPHVEGSWDSDGPFILGLAVRLPHVIACSVTNDSRYWGLYVLEVGDPAAPSQVFHWAGAPIFDAAAENDLLYVGTVFSPKFRVFSIESNGILWARGGCNGPTWPWNVCVQGGYAFVGDFMCQESQAWVIDATNPDDVAVLSALASVGPSIDVAVSDTLAFVTGLAGVRVFNVSDPAAPQALAALFDEPYDWSLRLAAGAGRAYVTTLDRGTLALDYIEPAQLQVVGGFDTYDICFDLARSSSALLLAERSQGLLCLDVDDLSTPHEAGRLDPPGLVIGVAARQNTAFAFEWGASRLLRSADVATPAAPAWLDSVPIGAAFALQAGAERLCAVADSVLSVGSGNPADIFRVGVRALPARSGDVVLDGDLAYVAARDSGLVIYDVGGSGTPARVGGLSRVGPVVGVAVAFPLAYLACFDTLWVVDVQVPQTPVPVGFYDEAGGCMYRVAADDRHAFVADGTFLKVLDVTVPARPREVAHRDLYWGLTDVMLADGHCFASTWTNGVFVFRNDREVGVTPPTAVGPTRLLPAVPNPFNPATRVTYELAGSAPVRLGVFDGRGRRVTDLVREVQGAGRHVAIWNGRDAGGRACPSGVYFLRLETADGTQLTKVLLAR